MQASEPDVAVAVAAALRNADASASLRLLTRDADCTLPVSSLLLLQSVRAAVHRETAERDPALELALLRERVAAASLGLTVSEDGLRVLIDNAAPATGEPWPATLRVVLVPADRSAPVAELSLELSSPSCLLSALASALHAPTVAPTAALGPRPKAGRPRGEPRLYVAVGERTCETENTRASWLAGVPLRGDALLAHVGLPSRRWGSADGAAPTPKRLRLEDVSLSQYEAMADATLPASIHARHGSPMPRATAAAGSPARAKGVLCELCTHFGSAPSFAVEEQFMGQQEEEQEDDASDEELFVGCEEGDAAWWAAALDETSALRRAAGRVPRPPRSTGFRVTLTPPAALGLQPRRATAERRAAAEQAAALATLWDAQALGEAALGRPAAAATPAAEAGLSDEGGEEGGAASPVHVLLFRPSLADQRRAFVTAVLRSCAATSLLDLGSGSGALLLSLAQGGHGGVASLRRAAGVELSESRTAEAQRALLRRDRLPFSCALFQASIMDADAYAAAPGEFDAVTCVEVVEHLPSEAEAHRAGALMLARLAPRVLIVTTPNADCNVALETACEGGARVAPGRVASGRVRDVDHKFEWTRAQFRDWAHAAVAASGGAYHLSLVHLGALRSRVQPSGVARLGASQAAVFVRRADAQPHTAAHVVAPQAAWERGASL